MSLDQDISLEELDEDLYERLNIKVDKGQEPLRVDVYLFNKLSNISRNKIQNIAKAGGIKVNNKAVKANYKIKAQDDLVVVMTKPEVEFELTPENIPLDIVYEDDFLLVIHKPAGMVVHPGYGNNNGTLVNALMYHFNNLPGNDERPGLIHRIDKDTSGLLVVAKEEYALTHLAKQFADHSIERKYVALVWGDFEEDEGTIEGNIGRHQRFRKIMDVYPEEDYGKHAITHYRVLERFGYVTLVECQLETGRTHQIRVHMQHIGHPLFNDSAYGGDRIVKGTIYSKYKQFVENCFKVMPRQALHARSLGFVHPDTGEKKYFESEIPEDFEGVLDKWRRYRKAQ